MDKYLKQLLEEYAKVILPSFGAIVVENEETGNLMFNEYLSYNDGKLDDLIVSESNMELQEAQNMIAKYIRDIQVDIDKGESYDIFELGRFYKNDDGDIEFEGNLKNGPKSKSKTATPKAPVADKPENKPKEEAPEKVVKKPEEKKKETKPASKKEDTKTAKKEDESKNKENKFVAKKEETKADTEKLKSDATNKKEEAKVQKAKLKAEAKKKKEEAKANKAKLKAEAKKKKEEAKANKAKLKAEAKKKKEEAKANKAKLKAEAKTKDSSKTKASESPKDKKTNKPAIPSLSGRQAADGEKTPKDGKKKKRFGAFFWVAVIVLALASAGFIYVGLNYEQVKSYMGWDKFDGTENVASNKGNDESDKKDPNESESIALNGDESEETNNTETTNVASDEDGNTNKESESPAEVNNNKNTEVESKPDPEPKPEPRAVTTASNGTHHLIAGSFSKKSNAEDLVQELKGKGLDARILGIFGGLHFVAAASYNSSKEARDDINRIRQNASGAWIFKYNDN